MYRLVPALLGLLVALTTALPAHGDGTTPYRLYTANDGLPSRHVTALAQTSNGLLWVGTSNGLVVYDGHAFRPVPMPDSVAQRQVTALHPLPDGSVWAGIGHDAVQVTPQGVTRVLRLDRHNHSAILRRRKTMLFVTDRAVWRLPPGAERPTRTPFRYEELAQVTLVKGADLGPDGQLWIVNGRGGPGRVRPDGTVVFVDGAPRPDEGASVGSFSDIQFVDDGTALVPQAPHLYRFDPTAGTFEAVGEGVDANTKVQYRGGTAYLTRGRQVRRYDPHDRQMHAPVQAGRPGLATVMAALRGREGGLWVGTRSGLLHFVAPGIRHLREIDGVPVQAGAAFRQHGDTLWASTWGHGLFQVRPRRRRATPGGETQWLFPRSRDGRIHALADPPVSQGRKWYRWRKGWQFVAHAEDAVRGGVSEEGIGYFWHNDGLYRHVPDADTTTRTQLRSWPVGDSQHHLMGLGPEGRLFLWDQGTLLRLGPTDGAVVDTIATYPDYRQAQGRHLLVDPTGDIWAPFGGSGLLHIDPEQGTTQSLLEGVNLQAAKMIGDSLVAANTRNEGIYLVDAETGGVRRHLTRTDGLLSNDINGSHLMGDTLYVGHMSGVSLVPTDSLLVPPSPPAVVLTGLEVNLEDRPLRGDSVLAADERAVGVSYTGASLLHPDRVRYEVRLTPRDTAWKATDRPSVRYTNLEPGTYRFQVRARLGRSPPGPAADYTFRVPPHFYETWWFRGVAGLLVIGAGGALYYGRVRRLEHRQAELQRLVDERTRKLKAEKRTTEQQARRLAELDEAKNRFFAHVSHEFRTPLSLLLTPLQDALQRGGDTLTFGRREVRRMVRNAERLRRLIDQLMDLATLEAGRMTLNRTPTDVAALVTDTAEALVEWAQRKHIDLTVSVPDEPMHARVDPDKVEKIVSNLLSNALKYTPEHGRVALTLRADGSTDPSAAHIQVSDTGPGIGSDQQEHIFKRFEQGQASEAEDRKGVGLGLALTKEFVELHGGTIHLDSTPGEGTTFEVSLPLAAAEPADATEGAVPPEVLTNGHDTNGHDRPPQPRGDEYDANGTADEEKEAAVADDATRTASRADATVLLVEDNAEMQAFLVKELGPHWEVQTASDGAEAWEQIQEAPPDLVVSDVMMPEVDGFELCRRIKADETLQVTPVLLLTARAHKQDAVEGLDCGADDYISKPFDVAELRKRIDNQLLARRRLQDHYEQTVEIGALDIRVHEDTVPFVEQLIEVVEEHLGDPDLTVDRLADALALSRRQTTRRCKEAVGDTPAAFIRQYRLRQAKQRLRAGDETVAEVAYAVGFRSTSHFSQSFKDEVGCPPSTYADRAEE